MSQPGMPEPETGDLSAPRLPPDMRRFGPGPPFVVRLRKALCEPALQDCIAWRKGGTVVAIHEPRFCRQALGGRLFRTTKMASFVRNLNKHSFHKLLSFGAGKSSARVDPHAPTDAPASTDPSAAKGIAAEPQAATVSPWLFFMNPLFVEDDPCFELQVQIAQPGVRMEGRLEVSLMPDDGAWQTGLCCCRSDCVRARLWRHDQPCVTTAAQPLRLHAVIDVMLRAGTDLPSRRHCITGMPRRGR